VWLDFERHDCEDEVDSGEFEDKLKKDTTGLRSKRCETKL